MHTLTNMPVILKKRMGGKTFKLAKIAGLNKFLRIYYASVNAGKTKGEIYGYCFAKNVPAGRAYQRIF